MVRETTDPAAFRVVQLDSPGRSWLKTWAPVLAFVATVGAAGGFVYRLIAWPWETKAAATEAHAKLQSGIDTLRDEQRERDAAASNKLDLILQRLPEPKKGRRP
jgi:hypothetical protein